MLIGDEGEGQACLSDFGLSGFSGPEMTVISTMQRGATRWMAPELLQPEKFGLEFQRTRASDMFAFACVAYEVRTTRAYGSLV